MSHGLLERLEGRVVIEELKEPRYVIVLRLPHVDTEVLHCQRHLVLGLSGGLGHLLELQAQVYRLDEVAVSIGVDLVLALRVERFHRSVVLTGGQEIGFLCSPVDAEL